jgi:3D-(3,5/4)-trihydroxycyclohexane-1,2-dione acylhydrolase (decyclizing)
MGAISALQIDQYGADFGTSDTVEVDYVAWARAVKGVSARYGGDGPEELVSALQESFATPGLSVVHVPVYFGPDPLGGLGSYGAWNVGEWTAQVQREIEKTLI